MPRKPFDVPLGPELEAEGLRAVSLIERLRPLGRRALHRHWSPLSLSRAPEVWTLIPSEKVIFLRLLKNVRMQGESSKSRLSGGARNPESGVAMSKERLLATPVSE